MALPKRNNRHQFTFETSTGNKIKYMPWLVKNEQEFMYATEGLDRNLLLPHIEEMLSLCIEEDIDFGKLSDVDFLRLAIAIRIHSKGSEHEMGFVCPHCDETNADLIIDLSEDINYEKFDSSDIELNEMVFTIKELSKAEVLALSNVKTAEEKRFMYIVYSIAGISVDNEVYTNLDPEEIKEFLGAELTNGEYKELVNQIIVKGASISITKSFNCIKCDKVLKVFVDDIVDFFV